MTTKGQNSLKMKGSVICHNQQQLRDLERVKGESSDCFY